MRRYLTTFFRDGGSHLMFDNVRELDSAVLQAALTAPDQLWTDRLLGSNTEGRYPNALRLGGDLQQYNGNAGAATAVRLDTS